MALVFPYILACASVLCSSVNFFSFMVIKMVLAQIQFLTVLIVVSVVILPFVVGGALVLWWDELGLVGASFFSFSQSFFFSPLFSHFVVVYVEM